MKISLRNIAQIILICSLLTSFGCGIGGSSLVTTYDSLYVPSRAEGFRIDKTGNSSVLVIKNPWQGAENIEMQIFVSRNGDLPPEGFEGTVVTAPLKRVVCMSSSYTAFIDALGEIDAVKGISGVKYMTNDTIRAKYSRGELKDVGVDSNLNYELLASLKPELVLIYGVAGESSVMTAKMRELNIPVAYIGDYLENSPLGKAEWIVAIGELFNKREQAIEVFNNVSRDYLAAKEIASSASSRPEVMINAPWRDTWFIPGDRNYMVQLIKDAGGEYAGRGVDSEQSRAISSEAAFVMSGKTDIWLNPNQASSLDELKQLNPKFGNIPPVLNGMVFNNTLRTTPEGGSDFWESGTVRPDIILLDLVKIFHPELVPQHELYYYKQLR